MSDIAAAANVFAYQGDLTNAAKTIDLADQVRREVIQTPGRGERRSVERDGDAWRSASSTARRAFRPRRSDRCGRARRKRCGWRRPTSASTWRTAGASAAIGLFTGPAADSSALDEYRTLTGESLTKEVRALLALSRGDSAAARRALAEPDSVQSKVMYATYRRPLAAQAYYLLGDYQATLRQLQDFEPEALQTGGFDSRWGMLGRVRLLRAAAFEQLGRRAEARQEYQEVLASGNGRPLAAALRPPGAAGAGPAGERWVADGQHRSWRDRPSSRPQGRGFSPAFDPAPTMTSVDRSPPAFSTPFRALYFARWPSVMVANAFGHLEESPSSNG